MPRRNENKDLSFGKATIELMACSLVDLWNCYSCGGDILYVCINVYE